MPRSFEVSFESPASVQEVHAAFWNRDYWLDRLAAFGGAKSLDALRHDPDGTVTVTVSEDLRRAVLPGMLTRIYRGEANVRTIETWAPDGDGGLRGDIDIDVVGAPGSGSGTAVLAAAGTGSRLELTATVEFNVPLVGGKIESYVAGQFADGFANINLFTTNWIAERA